MITRRAFLVGAGATLAACTSAPAHESARAPARVVRYVSGNFTSVRRLGRRTGWTIAYPPGHAPGSRLPVLIALHARGGDHTAFRTQLHLDQYLAVVVRGGTPPFAIASVDGGNHGYWHPRASDDPAGMVIDEFLPLLSRHGLDTARVGLFGWSMGGYGALYLSTVLGAPRVAVCVAESPAVWHHSWQSAAGAFDDAADFDTHSIWTRTDRLRGIAVRIDCGAQDLFAPTVRDLRAAIHPTPAGGIEPGGHNPSFWHSQAPAQLRFAGAHLAG